LMLLFFALAYIVVFVFIDIVSANLYANSISVLFNTGTGLYAGQSNYSVGSMPLAAVIADMNGDGALDIVSANSSSDDLSILLNLGNGTFVTERRVNVGDGPGAVIAADLDGDGLLDLACANNSGNTVSVVLSQACVDSDSDGYGDPDHLENICAPDNCPSVANPDQRDTDGNGTGDACCCSGRVGDVNQNGDDEPSIGDIALLIDHLFISSADLPCLFEADVNQSGGADVANENITIGDVSTLIDYLFISGPTSGLAECL